MQDKSRKEFFILHTHAHTREMCVRVFSSAPFALANQACKTLCLSIFLRGKYKWNEPWNFNQHIKSLVQSCYLQIRNTAKVKSMLRWNTVQQLIRTSFPSSCNSLFTCLNNVTAFCNWCRTQQQDFYFYNVGHGEHHSSPGQIPPNLLQNEFIGDL